jgi:site-specific recombinase XerD
MLEGSDDDQTRVLLGLCGLCGLRISEALSVAPRDFDLDKRVIHVRGKGDAERKVPFSEEAFDVFAIRLATVDERLPLVGFNDRWARKLITTLGERVLNRSIASHDLRKTFGTAVNDKYGLRTAQELLGHASVRTTESYTLVTFETMRAAVEGI